MVVLPMCGVVCTILEKTNLYFRALYREILEQNLVSHMSNHYGNNWMLVDDNAVPHRANIVHEYLIGEDIYQFQWSSYSPDMNSIEHMWNELDYRLKGVHPQSQTHQELGQALHNCGKPSKSNGQGPWWTACHIVCRPWLWHMLTIVVTEL